MGQRQALGWLLLLGLLAGQVWCLYVLVPGAGEPYFSGQDKVAHAVLFGLPCCLALLLRARLVVLGILVHALVSEPLQGLLTSTRTPDVWDTVADLAGIAVAVAVVLLARHRLERLVAPSGGTVGLAP
ncbi:hypothetical protein [Ornithinimicrobium murale]|uniref:hypothetical protein n=1 Tax=Ornithinimicrobium murale TaxID=1050153 RepID=UPI000E0D0275|nr:hypothetical protein [Ornithinimicrobium murale]